MSNIVIQTPCSQANKKILNIRKSQSHGKSFYGFSIQLYASRQFDYFRYQCFFTSKTHQHIRILVAEIFKSVSKTNPKFMWYYFSSKNLSYVLKKEPSLPSAKSTVYGTNSVLFKSTLMRNNLSYFIKSSASVSESKRYLKTFGSTNCSFAKIKFVRCILLLSLVFISYEHCRTTVNMVINKQQINMFQQLTCKNQYVIYLIECIL